MTTIYWFRQDLRLSDNPALTAAAGRGAVAPVYLWAPDEEGNWEPGAASRWWLHHSLASIGQQLAALGSRLIIRRGPSLEALRALVRELKADGVVWCRRYEPAAIERDKLVKAALIADGVRAESYNGSLLHEPWTIATKQGRPYQVFTPFWKACQAAAVDREPMPAPKSLSAPKAWPKSVPLDDLELRPKIPWDRGFYDAWTVGEPAAKKRIAEFVETQLPHYKNDRNLLHDGGYSRLSPHLHFGEISPRQVAATVNAAAKAKGAHKAARQPLFSLRSAGASSPTTCSITSRTRSTSRSGRRFANSRGREAKYG